MKRLIWLLLAVFLLAGCTAPAGETTASSMADTSVPTEIIVQTQPPETDYQALFSELGSWYNMALATQYSNPQELRLSEFFYNGFRDEKTTATDEEWAQLKEAPGFLEEYDLIRLPAEKIDAVLQEYFGVSLVQLEEGCFEGLAYLANTDCYYMMHTDALGAEGVRIKAITELADGTIQLTYTKNQAESEFAVVVRSIDGGFQMVSNQPNP